MKINGFENINKDITFGQISSGTTFIVASDTIEYNQYMPIYMKCFQLHCEDNIAVDIETGLIKDFDPDAIIKPIVSELNVTDFRENCLVSHNVSNGDNSMNVFKYLLHYQYTSFDAGSCFVSDGSIILDLEKEIKTEEDIKNVEKRIRGEVHILGLEKINLLSFNLLSNSRN